MVLGTGALAGGASSLTISTLSVGSHSIITVYAGDRDFAGSSSPAVTNRQPRVTTPLAASARSSQANAATRNAATPSML